MLTNKKICTEIVLAFVLEGFRKSCGGKGWVKQVDSPSWLSEKYWMKSKNLVSIDLFGEMPTNHSFEMEDFVDVDISAGGGGRGGGGGGGGAKPTPAAPISEGKESWLERNSSTVRKAVLMMLCVMLFLLLLLGAMYYMHLVTEQDLKEEIRTAVEDATRGLRESDVEDVGEVNKVVNVESAKGGEAIHGYGHAVHSAAVHQPKNPVKLVKQITENQVATTSPPQRVLLSARKPWLEMRLPTSITPHHYHLDIDVDMHTDTYKGAVTIDVVVSIATNVVLLHNIGPVSKGKSLYTLFFIRTRKCRPRLGCS